MFCTACTGGEVRETLGLNRAAPDEFRVVSRPPLTVPPEFYLYPPEEARAKAVTQDRHQEARSLLFGAGQGNYLERYSEEAVKAAGSDDTSVAPVGASALPTPGEERLLGRIGVNQADGTIRETLRQESRALEAESDSLLDSLREPYKAQEPVVDAVKERERLLDNQKAGKAANEGEVPTITENESILDAWF